MEGYFQYGKNQVRYFMSGTGPIVVLLHGYLESAEVWSEFGEMLSGKFTVISVDLPGHGLSGIYGVTHSMDFMATAVKDLLESLGIKKIFLAGHSMGGYVTLAFLELFPEMLTGYCLFHSHPFADPPANIEKRKNEIRYVKDGKKNLMYPVNIEKMFATANLSLFPEKLRKLKSIASATPDDGIVALLNGMMARSSRASVMEEGKVPCLWIFGARDNYINHEEVLKKINLPANAEVAVLENSGHLGFIEEEEKALNLVTAFAGNLF